MGLAYLVYFFRNSIPELGGFSISSILISGLLGGGALGLLNLAGIVSADKEKDQGGAAP